VWRLKTWKPGVCGPEEVVAYRRTDRRGFRRGGMVVMSSQSAVVVRVFVEVRFIRSRYW
jgi:hypothetical protein